MNLSAAEKGEEEKKSLIVSEPAAEDISPPAATRPPSSAGGPRPSPEPPLALPLYRWLLISPPQDNKWHFPPPRAREARIFLSPLFCFLPSLSVRAGRMLAGVLAERASRGAPPPPGGSNK